MQAISDIELEEVLKMLPSGLMITENEIVDIVISIFREQTEDNTRT